MEAHFKSLQDGGDENYILSGELDISPLEEEIITEDPDNLLGDFEK